MKCKQGYEIMKVNKSTTCFAAEEGAQKPIFGSVRAALGAKTQAAQPRAIEADGCGAGEPGTLGYALGCYSVYYALLRHHSAQG